MPSDWEQYRKDFAALVVKGTDLLYALQNQWQPEEFAPLMRKLHGVDAKRVIKELPVFVYEYQIWYSEARALIKQVLPDRLPDFISHYEKPRSRRTITFDSYRIEDCLLGVVIRQGYLDQEIAGPKSAIPHMLQQVTILESAMACFTSSLFKMQHLVQANLFDSELEEAKELARKKYTRAAGALAGVVLERHLRQICESRALKITKKAPSISDLNDALKAAEVIDVPQWRFVQHLGDIRNLCDHSKSEEPKMEQVSDLIAGISKIIKTIF